MNEARRLLKSLPVLALATMLCGCVAGAQSVEPKAAAASDGRAGRPVRPVKYDPDLWYKADFWGHEWPDGFTVDRNMTLAIRATPEIGAPKSVSCALRTGATYHPWNTKRVMADRLTFVTFTRIKSYELTRDHTSDLWKEPGHERARINFSKGDRWSLIGPGSEGTFMMRLGDDVYVADQDLVEASMEVGAKPTVETDAKDEGYHQWLKLRCANSATGWIFYEEIKDAPGVSHWDDCGFGCAEDRKPTRRSSQSPTGASR
ncbi:hypothetical protein [Bradyrhizobium sp. HKCCYLS20291]|uniref:hypothetical protein n=1 Tax=Bradyrhizobium sp. HKCCYLS20291 TaxID=3420766 RepID=UPI003EBCCF98